ncbi:MAG TPA: formylglycine-generating enzyme family protein [Candidatus Paceibacterota bacterium]|nr:formylglycine-generating enzyme family protein [Candidatus Paceibacterota bacterium]HRZ55596.1 formylglycine-generating enzyme family protein [Candidatus Paceibacterota bacterium]
MKTHSPRFWAAAAGSFALAAVWLSSTGCEKPGVTSSGLANDTPAQSSTAGLVPLTNMVPIKAGSFVRIRQPVTITRDYWLGRHEVTQAEYSALMGGNPSHFQGDSNCPVEKLNWFEAEAYCAALSERERQAGRLPAGYVYRLPSEAEWEYACRAGSTNLFSFGDNDQAADAHAWTLENSESRSHPVGLKQANAWGLHDMHGNVWEWCLDWFAPYPETPATDPVGPASSKFKVFRGGGWNQEIQYARSANRFMMSPSNGIHFVGFRVALGPPVARSDR